MKLKPKIFMTNLVRKYIFEFSNYSAESIYYNDSNTLIVAKIEDAIEGTAIQ